MYIKIAEMRKLYLGIVYAAIVQLKHVTYYNNNTIIQKMT